VGSIESDEKPGLERKVQQYPSAASLTWTNLSVTVSGRGSSPSHEILQDCTGYAEAGSITAIMGPSGSGKSTLLDALAGCYPITLEAVCSVFTHRSVLPC
jgi:ABC-type multidrug transport system fused ATPase/permease subunit